MRYEVRYIRASTGSLEKVPCKTLGEARGLVLAYSASPFVADVMAFQEEEEGIWVAI